MCTSSTKKLAMQDMQRMLLQLPVPLAAFVKVKAQVQEQALAVPDEHAESEETPTPHSMHMDTLAMRLQLASRQIHQRQPGGPLTAYACTAGHCQVICLKACQAMHLHI